MGHTSGDDNIRFGAVIKAVDALGNTKLSGRAKKKTKKEMQKQFNNYFFSRLISYSQVNPQLGGGENSKTCLQKWRICCCNTVQK